ncbi:MAG: glycosyltransferase family 39 protein, partial [Anaerolineae bacterium]|nr:glycosyltransferase family 39 protein [Anaerolineae bacterium]
MKRANSGKIITGLFTLINLVFILLISTSTSMEKNAIWWGLSLPRLMMVLVIVLATAGAMASTFQPIRKILSKWNIYLQEGFRYPLLVVFGGLFFIVEIILLILANLKEVLFLGLISVLLQRGFLFILWATFITLLGLITFYFYNKTCFSLKNWLALLQNFSSRFSNVSPFYWISPLIFGLIIGVMLAYSPAFSGQMPRHDSGIFLYFGSRILKGDVPFRDLWDHKPPLVFYINALGLWLFNRSIWGVWWLEVISLFSSALLLLGILRKNISKAGIFLALTAFVVNIAFPIEGGNFTEEFGLPLQCLALLLFYQAITREKGRVFKWVLLGFSFALALMLKQTLIGIWATIGLIALYRVFKRDTSVKIKHLAAFFAGFTLTLLAWVVYFAANHALWDFWDVAYRFNFVYSDITLQDRLEAVGIIIWVFLSASWFYYFGLAVWAGVIGQGKNFFLRQPLLVRVALIDFPIEVILISLSGKNYNHYFFTLLPSFAILAGYGWLYLSRQLIKPYWKVGLYLLLLFMFLYKPLILVNQAYRQPPEASLDRVVKYIRQNTRPEDYVLMWGSQTVVNFMSERDTPTR